MRVIVTGGAGFIGSAVCRHLIKDTGAEVTNLDKLTYAGNLDSLRAISGDRRYRFAKADICDAAAVERLFNEVRPDAVLHLAAESHVDRSITGSRSFVDTNIIGTYTILEAARRYWYDLSSAGKENFRFLHISTDEVYGSLGADGLFSETTPYDPSSPYAASKAASDHLAVAWYRTYGLPVIVSNCSNNYGPYQFPEKLIPVLITNAMDNRPLPIYGDGLNVREWIYADEHSRAVLMTLERGMPGNVYNIGSGHEKTNLEVVREILRLMKKPESLIQFVKDRPGHDRRYAMDCSKIQQEWNWSAEVDFSTGLAKTIEWYRGHLDWIREIKDASYLSYYDRMYTRRDQTFAG